MELYDVQAEQSLISKIIKNNDNLYTAMDIINESMFYNPTHGTIYSEIKNIILSNQVADPTTISSKLNGYEWFKDLGGNDFAKLLLEKDLGSIQTKTYCNIISTKYKERIASASLEECISKIGKDSIDEVLNNVSNEILELSDINSSTGFVSINESSSIYKRALDAYKTQEPIRGVRSGFNELDAITGGLRGGKLIILAARPSMGKSALAFNIAQNSSVNFLKKDKGAKIGIFSLEMGAEEIKTRIISGVSRISQTTIDKGQFSSDEELERLNKAEGYVNKLPIYIDDTPALHINKIRARATKIKRKHNIGLLIVDYIQLCRGSNTNRVLEIGEITQGLKQIAKELDIPIIALSQLSRGLENRDNKRPLLSDLRDSGSIEQDADQIYFLHREEYFASKSIGTNTSSESYKKKLKIILETHGITELIVSKNRGGECKTINLMFDAPTTSFLNANININIGMDDASIEVVEAILIKSFGKDWINSREFYKNKIKFLSIIKKDSIKAEKLIEDQVESNYIFKGCSPLIIGAFIISKEV